MRRRLFKKEQMKNTYRSGFIQKLDGDGALYERDILNIILSNAYNGKDMSAVADKLLSRFPSVKAVLGASLEEVLAVDGVSEKVALYLKTVGTVCALEEDKKISSIKNNEEFLNVLKLAFLNADNEYVKFFVVNSRGKIINTKTYTSGNADKVEMPTDEFLSLITGNKPYGVYLAHNHINCSCRPSASDDEVTRKIALLCKACKVKFCDHAIINSDGEIFSYASEGRLKELQENN